MSKRNAQNQMNHDNWDEEEEPEEMGVFKSAGDDVLKTRVIKKAKRKNVSFGSGGSGGAFKGFAGFTASSDNASSSTSSSGSANSTGIFGSSKPLGLFNGSSTAKPAPVAVPSTSTGEGTSKPLTNGHSKQSSNRSRYVRQLKALNESVTQWIRKHVEKNPYCILTPIFADYNRYLNQINEKFPDEARELTEEEKEEDTGTEESGSEKEGPTSSTAVKSPTESSPAPTFKFGKLTSTALPSTASTTTSTSTPAFTLTKPPPTTTSAAPAMAGFSFKGLTGGATTSGTSSLEGFGSGLSGGGFSFAVNKPSEEKTQEKTQEADGEEPYEPPAPEVNQVKEDDAFHTQKCKLFLKKGEGWQERGVGHLHLKPCGTSTQLLIRADTSLGNILLNIRLTKTTPVNRQGKNNVTLLCVPNPPFDDKEPSKPATLLIRVKTSDDADELLKQINDHK